MYEESKIDLFFESMMNWAITGRICEDLYFAVRHYCFHILAALNCRWLPLIRQAEQQLKPYKEHLRSQYTWREQLGLGVWRPALIFIFPLTITVAIASIIDFPFLVIVDLHNSADSLATLGGYLKTLATVLATLTAILLAVIALTIQVKTSNLAGAGFLLNAVTRRRGFLPVAAFLSGTVLTSLFGVMLSNRLPISALNNYTCVAALFSFASLLILFNLLRRTMQSLGSSELEQMLTRELLSSLRISFRRTLIQALVERNFSEMLADLGFARYTATHKEEGHPIEYKLKRLGKIIAIDPAPLRRISNMLKLTPFPRERNTSSIFVYRPDDAAAFVTIQPNGKVTKDSQLALLTKEQIPSKQITRLIRKAFVIQKHFDPELPWQRLREVISSAIEKCESTIITTVANALTDTFDDYLEVQVAVAGQGKLLLEGFTGNMVYGFKPPDPFNLRLSDLVVYAGRIHSQDCLDELLTCIYRLAQTAFDRQSEKYFREWIFEFYWAYFSFGTYAKDDGPKIAPDVTRRIHWLSDMLRMYLDRDEKSVEQVQKVSPYAISYFSLCLRMVKTSAERYDQSTFDAVAEHVMRFLKNELKDTKAILDIYRKSGQLSEIQVTPQMDDLNLLLAYDKLYDHKNLVYVVAGASLMHKVKANELKDEKLTPFFEKLIANAPDFRSLLDLYAMPGMADMTTSHDNPLGFDSWDWPHSHYPKTRHGTDFQRWIRPFYQFLLLKKALEPSARGTKLHNIRQTQMASHDSLRDFLTKIAADKFSLPIEYQEKPWGIKPKDLEMAKKQLNRFLGSCAKQQDPTSMDEI